MANVIEQMLATVTQQRDELYEAAQKLNAAVDDLTDRLQQMTAAARSAAQTAEKALDRLVEQQDLISQAVDALPFLRRSDDLAPLANSVETYKLKVEARN